jgi:hypothetical protein
MNLAQLFLIENPRSPFSAAAASSVSFGRSGFARLAGADYAPAETVRKVSELVPDMNVHLREAAGGLSAAPGREKFRP